MSKNKKWKLVDKNIYRKGHSQTYWIRLQCRGRTIERPIGPRLKDARDALVEIKSELNRGLVKRIPDVTFEEVAERVIEHWEELRDPRRPATTIRHASKLFGGMLLRDITAWDIEQYKKMRGKVKKRSGKSLSSTTIRKELLHLNRFFVLAERWDMVPPGYNPVKKVDKPAENEGRIPELALEEEKRLLLACSPGIKPIVKFALYSGLRLGEILSLTWERTNTEGCIVFLDETKSGKPRYVRLCKTAVDILESLYDGQKEGHAFLNPKTGKRYKCIRSSFDRAKKRAGLDRLVFHDLRHVFASRLREMSISLDDIAEALGQSDTRMAQRYAHIGPDYMANVVSALDELDKNTKEKRNLDDSWTIGQIIKMGKKSEPRTR